MRNPLEEIRGRTRPVSVEPALTPKVNSAAWCFTNPSLIDPGLQIPCHTSRRTVPAGVRTPAEVRTRQKRDLRRDTEYVDARELPEFLRTLGTVLNDQMPSASCWHAAINVLRMVVHRVPVGLRDGRASRIRRVIGDTADACCIVLCCHLGFSSLNLRRISAVVTPVRVVTGLFELDQFGAYLCAGERRIRLGKHGNRSGKGSGNDNGLNKRFHAKDPSMCG